MDDLNILEIRSIILDQNKFISNDFPKQLSLPPVTLPKKLPVEKELSEILSKVQSDIQQIKNDVLANLLNGDSVDPHRIKSLFEKAEKDIETRKQDVRTQFYNKALTHSKLSLVPQSPVKSFTYAEDEKPIFKPKSSTKGQPSPGQKLTAIHKLKGIINPARTDARSLLNKHYGVPMPRESKSGRNKETDRRTTGRPVTGTTLVSTPMTPKENRINARLTPPPPSQDDKRKGVAHLIERKIIPTASRLCISPNPINQKQILLHEPFDLKKHKQSIATSKLEYNMALVKFDENTLSDAIDLTRKRSVLETGDSFQNPEFAEQSNISLSTHEATAIMPQNSTQKFHRNFVSTENGNMAPLPTILSDPKNSHKFLILNGQTDPNKQDFILFKQYYCLSWGNIASFIQRIEKLLIDFSVPLAVINGDRLADLALYFEAGPKPTIRDLLLCLLNLDDVEKFIIIPGRRYLAPDGFEKAATKIQSMWRCHVKHSAYIIYRRKKWAAGMIALTWIMHCKLSMIRSEIKEKKLVYLQNFRLRAKIFGNNWKKLKSSKRVIIHIPSLGYAPSVRESMLNINTIQNNQICRICDIKDPNVEVIYISPVCMEKELKQYYHGLIDMTATISNADADEMKSRLKIITPNCHDRFPAHNLCLSTILKYSIRTMERIKKLIKGKDAFIVPGMMHTDDLYIAEQFDIPILGSEPEVAKLYSMKSGVCRIFEEANVMRPPEEHDIYSLQQMYQSLARLIAENLHINRWLLKVDNQTDGRGTAFVNVTDYLMCYEMAMREKEKYGDEWSQPWAHESVYNSILLEMPRILKKYLVTVDAFLYPTQMKYLNDFCRHGGMIQGCPPTESVTGLTANVLIEPDGNVDIISVTDQIHSTSLYRCWGHSLPQSSIQPDIIEKATRSICKSCKIRGIIGYISIDFVTFIDPVSDSQTLWAVDLKAMYTATHSMVNFIQFISDCHYDCLKSTLTARVRRVEQINLVYQSRRKKRAQENAVEKEIIENKSRHCVFSRQMFHTNLNNVHYGVFFRMCKARGIGYDEKLRIGTTFILLDRIRKESIGMITLGETLEETIRTFASNLQIIHNDISSPAMQGKSNFQGAIEDLKSILASLRVNSELEQNSYPTLDPLQREMVTSHCAAIQPVLRNHSP